MTWSFFVGRLNHIWEERDGGESEIRDKGQRDAERWRDRDHICNEFQLSYITYLLDSDRHVSAYPNGPH
jgi:hypothetical protein